MRKVHITLVILFLVTGCILLNLVVPLLNHRSETSLDSVNEPSPQPFNWEDSVEAGYDLVVLINSDIADFESRQILRKEMFNLPNNLNPCLRLNGRIFYKFFVSERNIRSEPLRRLRSEIMEYDDIVTLPRVSTWEKEYAMLRWVNSDQGPAEYRHVMLLDSHTYVWLEKINPLGKP